MTIEQPKSPTGKSSAPLKALDGAEHKAAVSTGDNAKQALGSESIALRATQPVALSAEAAGVKLADSFNLPKVDLDFKSANKLDFSKSVDSILNTGNAKPADAKAESQPELKPESKVETPKMIEIDDKSKQKADLIVKKDGKIEKGDNTDTSGQDIVVKYEGDLNNLTPEQKKLQKDLQAHIAEWSALLKDGQEPALAAKPADAPVNADSFNPMTDGDTSGIPTGRGSGGGGGMSGAGFGGDGGGSSGGGMSGSGGGGGMGGSGGGGMEAPLGGGSRRAGAGEMPQFNDGGSDLSFLNQGNSRPSYDHVERGSDGGYRVGPFRFNYGMMTDFFGEDILASLGDPPDYSKLPELMAKLAAKGKISKEFAAKFKDKDFAAGFGKFLSSMKNGKGEITAADMQKYLPKDMQDKMGQGLAKDYLDKAKGDAGKVAVAMKEGKSPDKLTEAELNAPQNKELLQAAKIKSAALSDKGTPGEKIVESSGILHNIAQKAAQVASRRNTRGECIVGYRESMIKAGVPIGTHGSAYKVARELENDPRFVEIPASQALRTEGATVVYGPKKDPRIHNAKHGHVAITLANGQEASDHIKYPKPYMYKWARGFVPKAAIQDGPAV